MSTARTVTYEIEHEDNNWTCRVEIQHGYVIPKKLAKGTKCTTSDDAIKSMVEFWGWWEEDLEKCNGDYTQAFLKMLGVKLYVLKCKRNCDDENLAHYMKDEEGWWPLDGSFGIKLLSADDVEIERESFRTKEVPDGK